jgi:hypothetical protein
MAEYAAVLNEDIQKKQSRPACFSDECITCVKDMIEKLISIDAFAANTLTIFLQSKCACGSKIPRSILEAM